MKFIIYSPRFTPYIGGIIALYLLCYFLRRSGHDARITANPYPYTFQQFLRNLYADLRYKLQTYRRYRLFKNMGSKRHSDFFHTLARMPRARLCDVTDDTIIVYPEVTAQNLYPLKKVVRWILYKPGHETRPICLRGCQPRDWLQPKIFQQRDFL